MPDKFGIAIHGGAGTITKMSMSKEMEAAYRTKLSESITVGYEILSNKGRALDAVQAAVMIMEDSELFNAGKGAVFTHEGRNEQDASIIDGSTLECGAVAAVMRVKNPIKLARQILSESEHVLLSGEGAERFAQLHNLELVDADYFYTERRWNQLQKSIEREKKSESDYSQLDHTPDDKHGTVGAVARDAQGNLAAATSSGGMTNKKFGRIGDSPIIGAGTYANNKTCAVSTTGHGEYFMRGVCAYDVSALMEYKGMRLQQATDLVIAGLSEHGGTGGMIAIDRNGNIAMPMNTPGMYRAQMSNDGLMEVKIYDGE
ncbi:MAG: isoaspartyl peptidase/L-asparaginase [bacterium]|nr:isoaspartyl peptidase/L-asparaginase [bacterium]